MGLTKDEILSAEDITTQVVSVPEWGGHVTVKVMSGQERDGIEAANQRGLVGFRARLAAATICDDAGERLFTDAEVGALGAKSGRALDRVAEVAMSLNGIGSDDVEELEKNSDADPNG